MSSLLIKNIGTLVQADNQSLKSRPTAPLRGKEMARLPHVEGAFLLVEGDEIADFGKMGHCPEHASQVIDASGKMVFPSWCDSHTHLVFAGSREGEFEDKIKGLSYEEIARKGGGILNSAKRLQETPEEVLVEQAFQRLEEVQGYGTGLIEIKSGYGLTLQSELKMLRVIRKLKKLTAMEIKATFLGAHAIPIEFKNDRRGYIDLIIKEMLPRIAAENLADYVDVFCEKVAFSVGETERVIQAAAKYGLKPKIHTNQFNCMGGIQLSVENGAVSVDHLERVNQDEIDCLKNSKTIATLLPSAPFFLNDPYPPARKLLDAGIPIALATDYNPGSSPSGRMPFVLSLACIKMKMTPEEVINAATLNGAAALELQRDYGSIAKGKIANFFITKPIPSLAYLPYAFGSNLIERVFIRGKEC